MSQNGKGDKPRPVDKKKYDYNYERIFRKKNKWIIQYGRFFLYGL